MYKNTNHKYYNPIISIIIIIIIVNVVFFDLEPFSLLTSQFIYATHLKQLLMPVWA